MKKSVKKVACPACHGAGGEIDPILDDGSGPFEPCGYCNGTGTLLKNKFYYRVLGYLSHSKSKAKSLILW